TMRKRDHLPNSPGVSSGSWSLASDVGQPPPTVLRARQPGAAVPHRIADPGAATWLASRSRPSRPGDEFEDAELLLPRNPPVPDAAVDRVGPHLPQPESRPKAGQPVGEGRVRRGVVVVDDAPQR